MKRALKVLGAILFAVGLLYIAGGLLVLQMTGDKLLAELQEIQKAGHPITLAQACPKPAESDNAAPIYDLAIKKLEKISAEDLQKLEEFSTKPAKGNTDVLAILTQFKSAIDDLSAAEGRSRCWFGDQVPKLNLAVQVLRARALYAAFNEQPQAALKDFRTLLHVVHCARQGPLMIEIMVADAMTRTAGELLPKLQLSAADWKSLLPLLDLSGFDAKVQRVMAMELIASIGEITGSRPVRLEGPSIGRRVLFPLRNHMASIYLNYWREASRLMKDPYWKSQTLLAQLAAKADAEPLLPKFSPVISLSFDKIADALVMTHARVQMLRLAVEFLSSDPAPLKLTDVNLYNGQTWKIVGKDGVWLDGGHEKLKLRMR